MIYKIPQVQLSYVCDFSALSPKSLTCSRDAFIYFRDNYDEGKIGHIEQFYLMLLNRNNRVLGIQKVSEGGVSGTVVDPKIILQAALLSNASAIILCHNHPSGNLNPSRQDVEITKKVKHAASFLDISINDHLIITPEGQYFSFADEGMM